MRWSHIGLNCQDQKATEEFYTRWFGFRRAREVDLGGSSIVFLRQGDAYLELFEGGGSAPVTADGDGPAEPGRMRHLAFQTDDVDGFLAAMGEEAVVTLGPMGFDDFICGWRTVWLRDPDGVIVEVSQGFQDDTPQSTDSVRAHATEGVSHD
ncbi:VOC family protein [Streptacidiphilus sp. N1-12]|uniref:VOC family protein n=2 Tax=Streptacidiphilus alkalitolerans TaxID=3342712 RepID=A0ABV6W8C8_9ACTN